MEIRSRKGDNVSSLYELNARIMTYEMEFDSDGVWINEDELNCLNLERDEKLEQLCLWIKNLRAEAEMVKAEAKNLTDRAKKLTNKADNLERYVAGNLDGKPFKTSKVNVTWRKSESVSIPDESVVPDRFMNIEVVRKPVKANIKKYLQEAEANGEEVVWAKLEKKNNIGIK